MKTAAVRVLVVFILARAAMAATFYVSPAGTGGGLVPGAPAGLQAALDAARVNGQTDSLFLATGTYDAGTAGANTFDFDAGLPGSDGLPVTLVGGWDAVFADQGEDAEATRLDGASSARVLSVKADATGAVAEVRLENLTVQHGMTNGAGAGVYASCSSGGVARFSARGCLFRCNMASNSVGGAIAAQGPVTVEYCDVYSNRAYSGGAVYLWPVVAKARFYRTGFWDNSIRHSASPYGWQGCTLFSSSPNLVIEECEINGMSDGSLTGAGSPLYLHTGGFVEVINTAFRNNKIMYWGSAVGLWNAGATLSGCLFSGNRAGSPDEYNGWSAVTYYNENGGASETIRIVNSTFVGNRSASDEYGDIYFRGGNLTILNSIFDNTTPCSILGYDGFAGSIDYCAIERGPGGVSGLSYGSHNTQADPGFQAADPDFKLNFDSALIDSGTNAAVPDDLLTDFKGAPRIFANKLRGLPLVDLGWDEYFDGVFELTAPTEYASWLRDGDAKTIAWTYTNLAGNMKIELWQGPEETGGKVMDIATVALEDKHYFWDVPADLPDATDYAVVVFPVYYPTLDRGAFPVAIQRLHLTSPDRGKWYQGSSYAITWESGGLPGVPVLLELYEGDALARTIASGVSNTGSRTWKVPYGQAPGSAYRVRVSTAGPPAAEDFSDDTLQILSAITLTAPNGGQSWKRGTPQTIAWKYKNKPGETVRLDLYRNGVYLQPLVAATPLGTGGTGSYRWTIPATMKPGSTYTVRVRSVAHAKVYDFSNRPFTITK